MDITTRTSIRNPEAEIQPTLPEPVYPEIDRSIRDPRFPGTIQPDPRIPIPIFPKLRNLRCGCYLINYQPTGSRIVNFDGTLRVECSDDGRIASGDLYQRRTLLIHKYPDLLKLQLFSDVNLRTIPLLFPAPNPAKGIPIFNRSRYRYYLRVTQILQSRFTFGSSFTLGFEMWRFTKSGGNWSQGGTWNNEGSFTAQMSWTSAPSGYPSPSNYLEGTVKDSSGNETGKLSMGWISKYLRKATIEIDRESESELPENNGEGEDWKSIFEEVGWDINVEVGEDDVPEPNGSSWTSAELHAALLEYRETSNLDAEWRYHLLCVQQLAMTSRGIMYDAYGSDSNNVPREGGAIASHWNIPNNQNPWGEVAGQRFGTATGPYFRTGVHEIGHAMCLYHNTSDNGIMNTTGVIANSCSSSSPFPNCIQWSFAPDDQKRLRHIPDIFVRPGGVPFGTNYSTTPISDEDLISDEEGLNLDASSMTDTVPLGAPVRLNITLTNHGDQPVSAPSSLSLKNGMVKGIVTDPAGTVRSFIPLFHCIEEHHVDTLEPGQQISHSLTLLRGAQGALFPMAGMHHIQVESKWSSGNLESRVNGEAHVMITAPVDEDHAAAALKVISTPDTLLTLVLGGDHLKDGIEALQVALDNPVLRPHFAHIEAKRLAEPFRKRKADLKAASELIDDDTVMSPAEIKREAAFVKKEGGKSAPGKKIAGTLKKKVKKIEVDDETKKLVDSL